MLRIFIKNKFNTSNNNKTIVKTGNCWNTCYGSQVIPYNSTGVHKWTIKIDRLKGGDCAIGIDEASRKWKDKSFHDYIHMEGTNHYGYLAYDGDKYDPSGIGSKYNKKYATNDIIEIVLDLSCKKLSFGINNSQTKHAFNVKNTNIGYCLAVALFNPNDSLSLISYNNSTEEKEENEIKNFKDKINELTVTNNTKINSLNNETQRLRSKITALQTQIISLQNDGDSLQKENINLKNKTKELTTINNKYLEEKSISNTKINSLNQLMNETLNEAQKLRNEINQIKTSNELQKQKITILERENGKLMEEQKDNSLKMNKLLIENKKLKMKSINLSKYLEWKPNDILLWILSFDDGRFTKYENILKKSLNEEDIHGIHLHQVDSADIKGWGIVNFADKKYILQKINELITKYNNKNNNEGNNVAPTAYI